MNPRSLHIRTVVSTPCRIEPLEVRIAPAATVSVTSVGTDDLVQLRIDGDDGADNIVIATDSTGNLTHNFPTGGGTFESALDFDAATPGVQSLNTTVVQQFFIDAKGGSDTVDISGIQSSGGTTAIFAVIDGGSGEDTIKPHEDAGRIIGGEGKDTVDFSATTTAKGVSYDTATGEGFIQNSKRLGRNPKLSIESVEDVRLGSGDDKATVKNNSAGLFSMSLGEGVNSLVGTGTGAFDIVGGNGRDTIKVTTTGDVSVNAMGGNDSVDLTGRKVTAETGEGADTAKLEGDEINATDSAIGKFLRVLFGTADLREKLVDSNGADAFSLSIAAAGQGIDLSNTNDPATAVIADLLLKGKAIDDITVLVGGEDNRLDLKGRNVSVEDTGGKNDIKVAATQNVSATMGNGANKITITSAATTDLHGGTGNDTIKGAPNGTNTIRGNGGTDALTGGRLNDSIFTGATSTGSTVKGGAGNDTLVIQGAGAKFFGEAGDDNVTVSGNNSTGDLGAGADFAEVLNGGHTIKGGAGNDQMLSQSTSADPNAIVKFFGGLGDDLLSSTSALVHQLFGDAGNDRIFGGGGADMLNGGSGTDSLDGGAGDDTVDGGGGKFDNYNYDHSGTNDPFTATVTGDGISTSSSDPGNPGADLLRRIFSLLIQANAQGNTLDASGSKMEVFLDGGAGNDTLKGGQKLSQLRGGEGDDTFVGGTGQSIINENIPFNAPSTVSLTDTSFNGLGNDTLSGLKGAEFNALGGDRTLDFSAFTRGGVTYRGASGSEIIKGTAQDDTLSGGFGNDVFIPGLGNDKIDGGDGLNTLDLGSDFILALPEGAARDGRGGAGAAAVGATVGISGSSGKATLKVPVNGQTKQNRIDFFNIQVHEGTDRNDNFSVVVGTDFVPTINARSGNDTVFVSGRTGASIVIDLGDGNDKATLLTVAGMIQGGKGNDLIDLSRNKIASIADGGDNDDAFLCKNNVVDNITGGLGADSATRDLTDVLSVDVESRSP